MVTSHIDPDGDSIGSQLALRSWLVNSAREVRIINQGKPPLKYLFLDKEKAIEDFYSTRPEAWKADLVFVLDCSNLERTGKVKELIEESASIVNIDHHPDNLSFGDLNYIDTKACALGEIIYELITCAGYRPNKDVATQLYAAIITDTGRFSFANTTPGAMRICAELVSQGADPKEINNQIYYNNSESALKLLGHTLQNLETYAEGKITFLFIDQKNLEDFGVSAEETERFVGYSLYLKGAEVGVLFKQKSKTLTKVSLRSQNTFDVSSLARIFGGGGHRNAAGCTIEHDLNSAKELVLKKIKEKL